MIIVADTSPLNYLVQIGLDHILPQLFGRVLISQAVFDEIQAAGAPLQLRAWASNLPEWVEVKSITLIGNAALDILDAGERAAILLAQELSANLLLADDKQARQAALDFRIQITGTLGVLDRAARDGLIDLKPAIEKLQATNFHISDDLIQRLLKDNQTNAG